MTSPISFRPRFGAQPPANLPQGGAQEAAPPCFSGSSIPLTAEGREGLIKLLGKVKSLEGILPGEETQAAQAALKEAIKAGIDLPPPLKLALMERVIAQESAVMLTMMNPQNPVARVFEEARVQLACTNRELEALNSAITELAMRRLDNLA